MCEARNRDARSANIEKRPVLPFFGDEEQGSGRNFRVLGENGAKRTLRRVGAQPTDTVKALLKRNNIL